MQSMFLDDPKAFDILMLFHLSITIWTFLRVSRGLRPSWLRLLFRTCTSVAGFICTALVTLLLLIEAACAKHVSIPSPDGNHVAALSYALQGALGEDYANVRLRSSWDPHAENIFHGTGYWDFKNNRPYAPEVAWLDNTHLQIRYLGGAPACKNTLGEIEIVCQRW